MCDQARKPSTAPSHLELVQATRDLITQVVTAKTAAKETFTAYDVSKAVQALQPARQLSVLGHLEMKGDVVAALTPHLLQNGGEYLRTPLPIIWPEADGMGSSAQTTTVLFYHSVTVDPRIYRASLVATNPAHALLNLAIFSHSPPLLEARNHGELQPKSTER